MDDTDWMHRLARGRWAPEETMPEIHYHACRDCDVTISCYGPEAECTWTGGADGCPEPDDH